MLNSFTQFVEASSIEDGGAYVAVKFDDATLNELQAIQEQLGIKNPVVRDDLHATVIYSPKKFDSTPIGDIEGSVQFESEVKGEYINEQCYVLKIQSEWLQKRNEHMAERGGEHTYDPYTPHITLSYDEPGLNPITLHMENTNINYEYSQPIDTKWVDKYEGK